MELPRYVRKSLGSGRDAFCFLSDLCGPWHLPGEMAADEGNEHCTTATMKLDTCLSWILRVQWFIARRNCRGAFSS